MTTRDDVERVKRRMVEKSDLLLRALALEATSRVVRRTPVDTGRARGNWNLTIGGPDVSTTEAVDPSGGQTIAKAQGTIQQAHYGDTVTLVNGLPYIDRLEHGWSGQAPAGMVGVTVAELQPLADQIATQIRSL